MQQADGWLEDFARSRLLRLLAIGALVLVLRVPVAMIRGLIEERATRRAEAEAEITGKWGHPQSLNGPVLRIPYEAQWTETDELGRTRTRVEKRFATFLPEHLEVEGVLVSEVRRRGIFDVPVYAVDLQLRGRFAAPDFSGWDALPERVHWERAVVGLGLSDPRVIQNTPTLAWADERIPFEAGAGVPECPGAAIHAPRPLAAGAPGAEFSLELRVHGSSGLHFAPLGRHTRVALSGDWPHPSFQGAWLPSERSIGPEGFRAEWTVSSLGRSYPQRWTSNAAPDAAVAAALFGVDLATPIDPYRLAERSIKYDTLFLGLTFGALWLFEILAGLRIHAVQYLLVGAAMTLFYLLELSFAEHLGFAAAYALASAGVVGLVAGYTLSILGSQRRGLAVGALVAGLHGALFVLLHDQDHALLIGSLGLFAGLATVMWLTRRVDWYAPMPANAAPRRDAAA